MAFGVKSAFLFEATLLGGLDWWFGQLNSWFLSRVNGNNYQFPNLQITKKSDSRVQRGGLQLCSKPLLGPQFCRGKLTHGYKPMEIKPRYDPCLWLTDQVDCQQKASATCCSPPRGSNSICLGPETKKKKPARFCDPKHQTAPGCPIKGSGSSVESSRSRVVGSRALSPLL